MYYSHYIRAVKILRAIKPAPSTAHPVKFPNGICDVAKVFAMEHDRKFVLKRLLNSICQYRLVVGAKEYTLILHAKVVYRELTVDVNILGFLGKYDVRPVALKVIAPHLAHLAGELRDFIVVMESDRRARRGALDDRNDPELCLLGNET